MDEEFIYHRLKALSGGIEREQYRDISKAFMEVVRYNEKAINELKAQIAGELRDIRDRFYLYGAVTRETDAPIVNDFLFPVSMEKAKGSIATIFCPCTRTEMKDIFTGSHRLAIETDGKTVEINARIRPCKRYFKKLEELKTVFYENGVSWLSPYLPYLQRFGDVFPEETFAASVTGSGRRPDAAPENEKEGETAWEIRSLRFMDRDYAVEHGLVPLWNVTPLKLKCTVFPVPAVDERNFRHILQVPFLQDGYVVKGEEDVKNVYMDESGLKVISEEKQQKEFSLFRIAVKRDIAAPHYGLTTNYRPMRHIDRQAERAPVRLMTFGEIGRIVGSYQAAQGIELREIVRGESGAVCPVEDKHQYTARGREHVCLKFVKDEPDFLTEDQIAFLVGEVQAWFPHFHITGELLSGHKESADKNKAAVKGETGS